MKGLLYERFALNKKWFLSAGIITAIGTILCAVFIAIGEKVGLSNILFVITELLTIVVCYEWIGRQLENDLKCRFVNISLAGGISRKMFVLTAIVENLIVAAIGMAMCGASNGVMCIVDQMVTRDQPFMSVFYIKFAFLFTVIVGIIEFGTYPLVIYFKNAEKAGLVLGLIFGFGVIMPTLILLNVFDGDEGSMSALTKITEFMDAWYFFPSVIVVAVVLYALFYVITLNRVKRGDVC